MAGDLLNCRVCEKEAFSIIDFGPMPIANAFLTDLSKDTYRFNLSTSFCETCSLFQIDEQPQPELMFNDHYPFFTGLSASMKIHFGELVDQHLSKAKMKLDNIFVVEIGSNDGTLLEFVKLKGVRHLGIDPSSNVVDKAREKGISAEIGFFGETVSSRVIKMHGQADFIFAANVVCHIPDLKDFGKGIKNLLAKNGQFIFEEPYAGKMIENTAYDQIYDEHVYIFSATSIRSIFSMVGLELVDAIPQSTHGGSMRYVVMHQGVSQVSTRLQEIFATEKTQGLDKLVTYLDFAERCRERRVQFNSLLQKLKDQGSRVVGYAATSKSTTVLNYCGIGPNLIESFVDSTIEKQGTYTPGSHIPVKSPEEMRINPPDYLILFAWNHEKEILDKEKELARNNVQWIRFVPRVEILNNL
jgi:methylation protein EvaC